MARGVNKVILIGNLGADPELRYTGSGVAVASFTLAVQRDFKNQQGERETDFIRIVAWRQRAEFASNYLKKGRLVSADGRLQIRSYETQDGQRRTMAEVVVDSINTLDSGGDRAPSATEEPPPPLDENLAPPVVEIDSDSNPWADQ